MSDIDEDEDEDGGEGFMPLVLLIWSVFLGYLFCFGFLGKKEDCCY